METHLISKLAEHMGKTATVLSRYHMQTTSGYEEVVRNVHNIVELWTQAN